MKLGLFSDSLADAAAKIMVACLPFMTMGMIAHPALLIASGSIATVFLFFFIIRMIMVQRNGPKECGVLDAIIHQMWFPYVCGVAFAIGTAYGEVSGWWGIGFAGVIAIFIIIANCVVGRQENESN